MARVILHIGTHKTATTTVQETLAANRGRLARGGIVYPRVGSYPGHHVLATHWVGLPIRTGFMSPLRRWRRIVARYAGTDATVLLSSEEFSRWQPQAVDFAELAEILAPFEERLVVCSLRNQVGYLQSIFLQISRRFPARLDGFLDGAFRRGDATGVFLDYGALYDHVLRGFPPEEIVFLSYEAAMRGPGSIVGALLTKAGAPPDLVPSRHDANVSPEPLAVWAASQVAAPAPEPLVARAGEALRSTYGAVRTSLYTRSEVAQVAAHFAPSNRAFEDRYRAVDPGFALAPLGLADDLVYREDVGATFWERFREES